jgi:hypothetical protein
MASYAPERLLKLPSEGWPRVALAEAAGAVSEWRTFSVTGRRL